ncbi:MAG: sigma-70 family RNA polymerase sigma factor [Bacteroidetes bacterium]|nr:MAG: sigma-70 family RNA polymerase sigma factor [Bacteroidota bacterium]
MKEKLPHQYSDNVLIEGSLKQDRHLQEMLYRKYADAMYTLACNYSENDDEAADILQESFIKVFRKLKDHDKEKSLGGWIRRIVINTAIEHFRRKKRYQEVIDTYCSESADQMDILEGLKDTEIVSYVNKLPAKAQMVLKLFTLEGYGHQEIADALKISVGTSKSQLNRAKMLLKDMIKTRNE